MKCQNCGAELEEGVLFCRECGSKVVPQKRFCRECGAELAPGVKFCSNCGAKVINIDIDSLTEKNQQNDTSVSSTRQVPPKRTSTQAPQSRKRSTETFYNEPLGGMPKQKKKSKASPLLIALAALLLIIIVFPKGSSSKGRTDAPAVTPQRVQPTASSSSAAPAEAPEVVTTYTIEKGTEYAFMSDEWNVYIARAVSDSLIKLEHWDKTLSSTKTMSFDSDLGTYKINDPENGFTWIDEDHTAFTFTFQDKNNSHVKKLASHIFTINISDSDRYKGTDYDESIACYSYENDDWHMYRAIPLTDTLIKIECWSRSSSMDKYCFGWDWCLIDWTNTDTDFEWTDDEHETFWVYAESEYRDGVEWFQYNKIIHTKNPNDSLFGALIESDKIMVDLVAHISESNPTKCRDHGMLFKMWPADLPLLFGEPEEYDLTKIVAVGRKAPLDIF